MLPPLVIPGHRCLLLMKIPSILVYEKAYQLPRSYGNQNDPSPEFSYVARPDFLHDDRVVQRVTADKESSRTSGRSSRSRGKVISDGHKENVVYAKRSYSSNSCREQGRISQQQQFQVNKNVPYQEIDYNERKSRPQIQDLQGSHRKSLSSDGIIISIEIKHPHMARSSSLNRERCEEEQWKATGPTHPLKCQCSSCLSQLRQIGGCEMRYERNGIDSRKSSKLSNRSDDKLKNIASSQRSRTPPYLPTSAPASRRGSPIPPHKSPVPNTHNRPPSSVSQKGSYKERDNFNNNQTLSSPLCTRRLKPTRQPVKKLIFSILENGEVCIENLQKKKGYNGVIAVCKISYDGRKIITYKSVGSLWSPSPKAFPPKPKEEPAEFTYETLPQKYWEKYNYCARFVERVKERTPKVTHKSSKAKGCLMENFPDPNFEAVFDSGEKLLLSNCVMTFEDKYGEQISLNEDDCHMDSSSAWVPFYKHALMLKEECVWTERTCSDRERHTGHILFPLLVGDLPSESSGSFWTKSEEQKNISPVSVQSSYEEGSLNSEASMDGVMELKFKDVFKS